MVCDGQLGWKAGVLISTLFPSGFVTRGHVFTSTKPQHPAYKPGH